MVWHAVLSVTVEWFLKTDSLNGSHQNTGHPVEERRWKRQHVTCNVTSTGDAHTLTQFMVSGNRTPVVKDCYILYFSSKYQIFKTENVQQRKSDTSSDASNNNNI